jgi:hypothetical protein
MRKKWDFIIFTVIFFLSSALVFCAGYYRKSISGETSKFKLDLLGENAPIPTKQVVFDIQNEGTPKKFLQPGRISISTGHGSGIVNKSSEPVWVQVKTEGFIGNMKIESYEQGFDESTACFTKALEPGDTLELSVNLDIPQNAINEYLVSEGKINILDAKNSKLLGMLPVKVINSLKKPCCTEDEGCSGCGECSN